MEQEVNHASNASQEMQQILSEFMVGVVKLEQLEEVGKRLLVSFQQALGFLRRPLIDETSKLVQSILKENETRRVKSYVEAGYTNAYDSALAVSQANTSLSGLLEHLIKAKSVLGELELVMNKAEICLQEGSRDLHDRPQLGFDENMEQESTYDAAKCGSFMAVIYSMVKQNYNMQERVVAGLGLMTNSAELDSYCLMWSLRPFVIDDVINDAISYVK